MNDAVERSPVAPAQHRLEDPRLLVGEGRYLENAPRPPGCLYAALVRSDEPSARVESVDTALGLDVSGVEHVLTGRDLEPYLAPLPNIVSSAPDYLPIAVDTVRFVGEPVAVVLATSPQAASDGASAVAARLEPLTVVDGIEAALAGLALVHDSVDNNVVWERSYTYGDPATAFAQAERIVSARLRFPRYNSTPLETFGVVARWLRHSSSYEIDTNFQGPFSLVSVLARGLRVREHQVRIKVPEDIGGSFGIKAMVYPYAVLIAACSRAAGRPVAWFETRSEHLLGAASGTERLTDVEVAVTEDGVIEAIRTDIVEDVGAYLRAPEPSCVMRSLTLYAGPYRIRHGQTRARLVLTNRVPTGLNRGYGGQQHSFTIERIVDAVAHDLGFDVAEIRRRNLLRSDELPFQSAAGTRYDSGDYHRCLELALQQVDYAGVRQRQSETQDDPGAPLIGIGVATVVHSAAANIGYVTLALTPEDRSRPGYLPKSGSRDVAEVALLPSGRLRVKIATAGAGQGHATTAAQIAAGVLNVSVDEIDVVDRLDTAEPLWGTTSGSYSSRFSVIVGGAIVRAARQLRRRLIEIAATSLESHTDDVELVDGVLRVRGVPDRALSLRSLAGLVHWDQGSLPPDTNTNLVCTATFSPSDLAPPDSADRVNAASTYGFMADIAVVEIDRLTGDVRLRSYVAVHDVGRALNAALVEGQIAGGIAHGVAGALYEHLGYDTRGQPTNSSLLTYLCPSAAELPSFSILHHDVPSPFNDLGVKGCGENSAMSAPAAIAAAVEDALKPYEARITSLPITPELVWRSIIGSDAGASATETSS